MSYYQIDKVNKIIRTYLIDTEQYRKKRKK